MAAPASRAAASAAAVRSAASCAELRLAQVYACTESLSIACFKLLGWERVVRLQLCKCRACVLRWLGIQFYAKSHGYCACRCTGLLRQGCALCSAGIFVQYPRSYSQNAFQFARQLRLHCMRLLPPLRLNLGHPVRAQAQPGPSL